MKDNLHELIFVLDQSAVIENVIDTLTKSLKKLVAKQKKTPCQTNITMSMFGSEFRMLYDACPINNVSFKGEVFPTSGVCPFIDATMSTMDIVGKRLSDTDESERPSKVIVAIIVFGRDNASRKHTYDELKKMIEQQTNVYNWQFFLMTDFSIVMEKIGIPEDDTVLIKRDEPNCYENAYSILNEKISMCRQKSLLQSV